MISVIIPCWIVNEEILQLTKNTIESLGEVNLIIVDNGSLVGGGYLRSIANIYIRNKENLGYAKAVNEGLKLVKTEYIAIVNNDTRISPNWQEVTKEVFEKDDKTYSCHFKMTDYDTPFTYGNKIAIGGKERWCTSSFFVIKSWKPQLYDENYFNTYEDYDYWYRIRSSGWKQAYTNKAIYQHKHSFTQKFIPERAENDKKNYEYFKKKWGIYPDIGFAQEFPEQIKEDYWSGFL